MITGEHFYQVLQERLNLFGVRAIKYDAKKYACFTKENQAPYFYYSDSVEYQSEYRKYYEPNLKDATILFEWQGKIIGVWPLSIVPGDKKTLVSSQGTNILIPIFIKDLDSNIDKKIAKELINLIIELEENEYSFNSFRKINTFNNSINNFERRLLENGYYSTINYSLNIDLTLSLEEIKTGIGSNFKNLINKSLAKWNYNITDINNIDENQSTWQAFRELHFKEAGKRTRSDLSWDMQHSSIKAGDGMLISAIDESGEYIGGSLFLFSPFEGIYAVSVYRRNLPNIPVGHGIQWLAVQKLKELNIQNYRLGEWILPKDLKNYDKKNQNINFFKENFASTLKSEICYTRKS